MVMVKVCSREDLPELDHRECLLDYLCGNFLSVLADICTNRLRRSIVIASSHSITNPVTSSE